MTKDDYYKSICDAVSKKSKCLSRQIGAIVVQEDSIVATGYNGPPRGMVHCDKRFDECGVDSHYDSLQYEKIDNIDKSLVNKICPRQLLGYKSGEGLHLCPAGHAEANCINNAARNQTKIYGGTMYMSCPIPCKNCLISIINSGIKEIVVSGFEIYDNESMHILTHTNPKLLIRKFNEKHIDIYTLCNDNRYK
jgi:dCMP deaminase